MEHPKLASETGCHEEVSWLRQNLENCCIVLGDGAAVEHTENSAKHAARLRYNSWSAGNLQRIAGSLLLWKVTYAC